MDTGQVRYRVPLRYGANRLQIAGETVQINGVELGGLDLKTGRLLWKKSYDDMNCIPDNYPWSWWVDAASVYVRCSQYLPTSSRIVALSAQTGQIQWESTIVPITDRVSDIFSLPSAIAPRQLITFRGASEGNRSQYQVIALDRQTGKLTWSRALFYSRDILAKDPYIKGSTPEVAIDRDKVFFLDAVPRWQLWLLRLNRNWYLNPQIKVKS